MKRSTRRAWGWAIAVVAVVSLGLGFAYSAHMYYFAQSTAAVAQTEVTPPPGLGTAASFAVLGGSTVTNTGPSVLGGNLGVSPGTALTGFPPGTMHGAQHKNDGVALQAQKDVKTAYNSIGSQPCTHDLTGQDLNGKSLVPGVYCFSSSAQLTGNLTLSGNGVFLFQIASTLTTGSNARVGLDGADPCKVFWRVGSSAAIGTFTSFVGNVLALTSISANHGAKFNGGLYARNGAVTLDDNTVNRSQCQSSKPTPTKVPTSTPAATLTKYPGMPNTGSDPNQP